MDVEWGSGIFEALNKLFGKTRRPAGEGKHVRGRSKPPRYRAILKAQRKAEREHRKRVRRQAAGRKHVR